mgnify:CR=1 FL=1
MPDFLNYELTSMMKIILTVICILSAIPIIKYSGMIHHYKEMLKTNEY